MKRIILTALLTFVAFSFARAQYAITPSYCANAVPETVDTYMVKSAGKMVSLREAIRVDTEARNVSLIWFASSATVTASSFILADLSRQRKITPFKHLTKWYNAEGDYKDHYYDHYAVMFDCLGYMTSAMTAYTGAVFVYEQCRLNRLRKVAVNLNSITYTF